MIPIGLIFNYIALIFLSWVFIHLMAGLGIFFAFFYLILWFFIPERIPDFLSHLYAREETETFRAFPKNFLSVLGNFFLILFVSILSMGLVWAEGRLLLNTNLLSWPFPQKTAYFSIPPKGQYRLGEIFPMKIDLAGLKKPINAVQVDVGFNPNRLEIAEISTQDSFAKVFIQKEIENDAGYARLTGGIYNPGYTGEQGHFATFYFKGISPGLAKVEFLPTSLVLANDGKGTNLLKNLSSTSFLILPEKISQEEQKQQQVMFEAKVLGETEEKSQLVFYEEGSVLGKEISDTDSESLKKQVEGENRLANKILWAIKSFDEFILSFWRKMFNLFGRK